jgi:di/tricarboxylate transporter
MTLDQVIAFAVIAASLVLFAWARLRYDVVAMLALVVSVATGIVPADKAFSGFADPAVVTVAAVLIISQALQRSGAIGILSESIGKLSSNATIQITALTATVAVLSAFMNNVGALALMLPVALQAASAANIPASRALMPLAFGSLLGGLATLIGTPPNIIISSYRAESLGGSFGSGGGFGMFDFAPVGALVAVAGVAFVSLIGFRLIPHRESGDRAREELMKIDEYVTELEVPEGSGLIGKPIRELVVLADGDVSVVAIERHGQKDLAPPWYTRMEAGDRLIIEGDTDSIALATEQSGFTLVPDQQINSKTLASDDVMVIEAVVNPGSRLDGRTARGLRINSRYSVNILAVARQGRPIRDRIGHIRFRAGDVILIQGPEQVIYEALNSLGCLPLAERNIAIGGSRSFLPLGVFAAAIAVAAFGLLRIDVAFVSAVVVLVAARLFPIRDLYDSVEWPVIVLLGAFLPVGAALDHTGATGLLANGLTWTADGMPVWVLLAAIMTLAALLSAVINNAATAVLMAPIAVSVAKLIDAPVDAFLMAVAIGASSAFLTPIGHQSNLLVMGPGGYRFGDYWRLGLPLTVVTFAVATPLLMLFWGG